MAIKNIGVIGAGTMGSGIAQVFAASGYSVTMQDIDRPSVERGLETISNSLHRHSGMSTHVYLPERERENNVSP